MAISLIQFSFEKGAFFNLKKGNKRRNIPHFIYVFGRSQIRQKKKKKKKR
jgi:hypothetical protein